MSPAPPERDPQRDATRELPRGLSRDELQAMVEHAGQLLDQARLVAQRGFRRPMPVELKTDASPVTEVDRAIETLLRRGIEERFPDHGILGEEFGTVRPEARIAWVLDPIDGTVAFTTGKPLFGILVGIAVDGVPVAGLMDAPITGERWVGSVAHPTTLNGARVAVRAGRPLADAVLYCTSRTMFDGPWAQPFERLCAQVRWPLWNADCYAYGMLAAGGIDLVVERLLKPHDWCALAPIVEAAGGVMCDLAGKPLRLGTSRGDVVAATDPALAAAVVAAFAGVGS